MTRNDQRVRKTAVTLSNGRALMYFGASPNGQPIIPTGGNWLRYTSGHRPAGTSCSGSG
jgi:hypothetical protein